MAHDLANPQSRQAPQRGAPEPFSALRSEMDRVLDAFLGRGFSPWSGLAATTAQAPLIPSLDVRETAGELVVEAELPGLDEKDVTLTLNGGILTIRGEKKSERDESRDDYHLMERSYGSFQRAVRLGDGVDFDKARATFDKGVLRVVLPKRAEAVAAEKRIPISTGG